MQLGDVLTREQIRVPLLADSLEEAVETLRTMVVGPGDDSNRAGGTLQRLRSGEGGRILSPTPRTWYGVLREGKGISAALGLSPEPLEGEDAAPRALLLLRVGAGSRVREEAIVTLAEALGDPEVDGGLMTAGTAEEVRSLQPLMRIPLAGRQEVRNVMTPLSYRIYPDTPLSEVVNLMARRGLASVPVVGESLQVLGIVSAGDALRLAVQGKGAKGLGDRTARDVMSRSVLCLTEDQGLEEAAQVMANRDVAQLPVVREGELVGFLTREAVLRTLFVPDPDPEK